MTYESLEQVTHERFAEAGLYDKTLTELALPETQYAENGDKDAVSYVSVGAEDAPNVLLSATPMFTYAEDHMKLRWMAQQAVLGDQYRVVGVEGYVPATTSLNKADRKRLSFGDFGPLSERVLRAAEATGVDDAELVITSGYSLGADTMTQVAHDVVTDENKGILPVEGLIAVEAARTEIRGVGATAIAFFTSGNGFYDSVRASDSVALNEFWKIDPTGSKKAFNAKVNGGLMQYVRASLGNNYAILKGFANNYTEQQIDTLVSEMPVFVGRHEESKVCTAALFARLAAHHSDSTNLHLLTQPGDHSSDDNIRTSAQRTLFAVNQLLTSDAA